MAGKLVTREDLTQIAQANADLVGVGKALLELARANPDPKVIEQINTLAASVARIDKAIKK